MKWPNLVGMFHGNFKLGLKELECPQKNIEIDKNWQAKVDADHQTITIGICLGLGILPILQPTFKNSRLTPIL